MSSPTPAPTTTHAAPHAHHPNADHSIEFNGLAAYEKGGEVQPFSYNPVKLAPEFVDVAITHCGICGTDCHVIDSGWGPSNYPVIPGHEIVGHVARIGSGVTHLKVGDRVGIGAQINACLNRDGDCPECASGNENHCRGFYTGKFWLTYNGKLPDGQVTQGGYADYTRVHGRFVFKLPEAISSAEAAPLLCGGVTVFAPLQRHITRPNMKVGVIGIGGLGHMAVAFAAKIQASLGGKIDVVAISQSSRKKEQALALGATSFLDMSDKSAVSAAARTLDFCICTADGSNESLNEWFGLCAFDSTFCMVGVPNAPLQVQMWSLLLARVKLDSSSIGSVAEIEQMLAFAAKHNVRPMIERLPMEKANEGLKRVRDGTVRFRVVLENPAKA